jgi:hypothetical protein
MNSKIAPKSATTGGTSESDPNAGDDVDAAPEIKFSPLTTADKAGASIITILIIAAVVGGGIWIIL